MKLIDEYIGNHDDGQDNCYDKCRDENYYYVKWGDVVHWGLV
jgi:hypothetical protein